MRNALLEIDEMLVPQAMLEAARGGSGWARERLGEYVDGIVLYMHVISADEDMATVSIRELQKIGVIKSIKVEGRK